MNITELSKELNIQYDKLSYLLHHQDDQDLIDQNHFFHKCKHYHLDLKLLYDDHQ